MDNLSCWFGLEVVYFLACCVVIVSQGTAKTLLKDERMVECGEDFCLSTRVLGI